jgi:hypothetical protein
MTFADRYLSFARKHMDKPIKQAIISASALSLIYPWGNKDIYVSLSRPSTNARDIRNARMGYVPMTYEEKISEINRQG